MRAAADEDDAELEVDGHLENVPGIVLMLFCAFDLGEGHAKPNGSPKSGGLSIVTESLGTMGEG